MAVHVELPNGLRVEAANRSEVDVLYREIFVDEQYAVPLGRISRHGWVVDVGANIGLFALYADASWRPAAILCVEPFESICSHLRRNLVGLPGAAIEMKAAGDTFEQASFSFYPRCTVMSGRHTDRAADTEAIVESVVKRLEIAGKDVSDASRRNARRIADHTLQGPQERVVVVEPLHAMLERHGIEHVDLLKIDVEGDEYRVLIGLEHRAADVSNIVMELDLSRTDRTQVEAWFKDNGFGFVVAPRKSADIDSMSILRAWR